MIYATRKPLDDEEPLHDFCLFSAEPYGVYGISSDDCSQTPGSPLVVCEDDQYSSFNTNVSLDTIFAGVFNNLDLNAEPLPISTKNEPTNSQNTQPN